MALRPAALPRRRRRGAHRDRGARRDRARGGATRRPARRPRPVRGGAGRRRCDATRGSRRRRLDIAHQAARTSSRRTRSTRSGARVQAARTCSSSTSASPRTAGSSSCTTPPSTARRTARHDRLARSSSCAGSTPRTGSRRGRAYRHGRPRAAYRFRGVATGRRRPPKGFKAADFRVPTLGEVHGGVPAHADQHRDQGPHEGRGGRVRAQRRGPRPAAEAHQAPRPHRRLLQQEAVDRFHELVPGSRGPGRRGAPTGCSAASRRRRRRRLPAADHLQLLGAQTLQSRREAVRRAPRPGLRVAGLVRRRGGARPPRGAACSTPAPTAS